MFDLFRFVLLRPAVTLDSSEIISTTQDSDLQSQLERDRESPTPAPSMERTADQFLEGKGAVLTEDGDIETEMGLGEGEGGLLMVPPPHPAIAMDKAKSVAAVASLRIAPPDLHDLFFTTLGKRSEGDRVPIKSQRTSRRRAMRAGFCASRRGKSREK